MSTDATGPRGDRRPAGVIHAAPATHPPVNTTFCGQAHGLFWFGHVDFWAETEPAGRCPACLDAIAAALGAGGFRLPPYALPPTGAYGRPWGGAPRGRSRPGRCLASAGRRWYHGGQDPHAEGGCMAGYQPQPSPPPRAGNTFLEVFAALIAVGALAVAVFWAWAAFGWYSCQEGGAIVAVIRGVSDGSPSDLECLAVTPDDTEEGPIIGDEPPPTAPAGPPSTPPAEPVPASPTDVDDLCWRESDGSLTCPGM